MTLKLGTRGSRLAIAQSGQVAASLSMRWPGLHVDTVVIKTTGDRTVGPLADAGGKGLFVKELELALLDGSVDFAVHSYKDVPVTMPLVDDSNLLIASVPRRADARDVLVTRDGVGLAQLPAGSRIGTGSLRRRCQLLALCDQFVIEPIRGNIDTRLKKLDGGEFDAIVLAAAGVHRAGLFDEDRMCPIAVDSVLPAPGQGALALQCRRDDPRTIDILHGVNDPVTADCVLAERELVRKLNGDCHSPIAAYAQCLDHSNRCRFRAAVGGRDGRPPVIRVDVESDKFAHAVAEAFEQLERQGAVAALLG